MSKLKRIGLIGCGAIGSTLLHYLANDMASTYREQLTLKVVIVPERSLARVQQLLTQLGLAAKVSSDLTAYYDQLDWVIECAGHQALETHVVGALAHGCSAVVCSVGACANQSLLSRLEQAARLGGAHMQFVAGAVGAIDALAAARHSGLTKVVYQGIKPALAWQGTAAEQKLDLENLKQAHTFFQGDARQAALAFPQNANVAATIALAGVGFEQTRVELIADPKAQFNAHTIQAQGGFGTLFFEVQARPLSTNPKTSAQTAYSLIQAILNHLQPWHF